MGNFRNDLRTIASWRSPHTTILLSQICSGTAIVAITAAPYGCSTSTVTNVDDIKNRNAALVSILGESKYIRTNLMNIYAFHQSNIEIGDLSLKDDDMIIMRRTDSEKMVPIMTKGIPTTRSSSTLPPSSGYYFPCS